MMKKSYIAACVVAVAAASATAARAGEMRVATGVEGNPYWNACKRLVPAMQGFVDVTCLATTGSEMNIHLLNEGSADIAFTQSDALAVANAGGKTAGLSKVSVVGKEFVHLICNKGSGIDEASDLEDKKPRPKVLIGNPGSGAATTLQNWIVEDEDYKNVEPVYGTAAGANLLKLVNGDYDCALVISALGSKTMQTIDASSNGKLQLVALDDGDMNDSLGLDGEAVYEWVDIKSSTYPGLMGWWGVEVTQMDAILVGRDEWINQNREAFDRLSSVLLMNTNLLGQ